MDNDNEFSWIKTYKAIADALLERKMRRDGVNALYVKLTGADDREMIDPFTFFTTFNRGIVDIDRKNMLRQIIDAFELDCEVPADFKGIPTANHEMWQYFDNNAEAAQDCWDLFECALKLADTEAPDADTAFEFCALFDKVHSQENLTKARLTRTLYWMRPEFYLPFGEKTRDYVHSRYGLNTPVSMTGAQYIRKLQEINAISEREMYQIAARAYRAADESWWPDIADYDPDMSIRQWMDLLQDETVTSPEVLRTLRKMLELGGDATTDELCDERGERDRDYYATLLRGYARDAAKKMGRKDYKGSWWAFIFTGQNADSSRQGDYIWRLRSEVAGALKELDEG